MGVVLKSLHSLVGEGWPTNRFPAELWEELGRTIATFTFFKKAKVSMAQDIVNLRNALCHGAWIEYDPNTENATLLHYWKGKEWLQETERLYSKEDIREVRRKMIRKANRVQTPEEWPTNHIPSEFWEELGRTIGTFTFLEEALRRAYFEITRTRTHVFHTEEQQKATLAKWGRNLEKSLTDPLENLKDRILRAINKDDRYSTSARNLMKTRLEDIIWSRNALVHGVWVEHDDDTGFATLRWKDKCRLFSKEKLANLRKEVIGVTYDNIELVTSQGHSFPGMD